MEESGHREKEGNVDRRECLKMKNRNQKNRSLSCQLKEIMKDEGTLWRVIFEKLKMQGKVPEEKSQENTRGEKIIRRIPQEKKRKLICWM